MLTTYGNRYHRGKSYGAHQKKIEPTSTIDILVDTINGDLKFIVDGEDRGNFASNDDDLKSGGKMSVTLCSGYALGMRFVNPIYEEDWISKDMKITEINKEKNLA
jgi:hypothetical protein